MSLQLEPRENFVIVRQLQNHTIAGTFYVRAVVRNSLTDAIIDSINLTDQGGNRFKRTYQVPPDISGLGLYIDITTSVYTDSGYTTKSGDYGDENETYLVFQRKVGMGGGGGGGGEKIDYKKIKKMIDDAVAEIPKVEPQTISFKEVLDSIASVENRVKAIKMPEFPTIDPVNLQPVMSALKDAKEAILRGVEAIPARDQNEIQPMADALNSLDLESVKETVARTVQELDTALNGVGKFSEDIPALQAKLNELSKQFKEVILNMAVAGYKEKTPTDQKSSISPKHLRLAESLRS